MERTRKILLSSSGSNTKVDWVKVGKQFTVADLKNHYESIKSLSDVSKDKSEKKKIRQALILLLVNKHDPELKFVTYKDLENFLKISPDLRSFVVILRDALQGMTNMMAPYVEKAITFSSWAAIVEGRETIKQHSREKAKAIELAAKNFRDEQATWATQTQEVMEKISMEAKIDNLTAEALPKQTKIGLAKLTLESHEIAARTKKALNDFKAEQLKNYETNPSKYELPSAK